MGIILGREFKRSQKAWDLYVAWANKWDGLKGRGHDGHMYECFHTLSQQTAEKEFIRALAGKREWMDYTLTLKARKISGAEGFMVMFRIAGNEDRTWWNLGGWGNTADGIEADGTMDSKPGHIETGRWYDLKVTVSGKNVKCWLDGELIHDINYDAGGKVTSLYAVAATDQATGDLIVKVVNANAGPLETQVDLSGAKNLGSTATATVLTSESGTDENSLAEPVKVSPKTETLKIGGNKFTRTFPGNSFTVLRIPAGK